MRDTLFNKRWQPGNIKAISEYKTLDLRKQFFCSSYNIGLKGFVLGLGGLEEI